ncbi:leucine-rich repeat domain-containing protein [Oscillospiraceae bacterium 50-58]
MKKIRLLVLLSLIIILSACSSSEDRSTADGRPVDDVITPSGILEALEPADAKGECGENATWEYKDGVLTIKGTGDMKSFGMEVNFNFSIETYKGPWVYKDGTPFIFDITSIIIEEGITSVGGCAFYHCEQVTSISIPETVTSIGADAFNYCESLEEITLPSSITSIGLTPFLGCDNLKTVTLLCDAIEDIDDILNLAGWGNNIYPKSEITIYYDGYGYDEWIEWKNEYTWKQISD